MLILKKKKKMHTSSIPCQYLPSLAAMDAQCDHLSMQIYLSYLRTKQYQEGWYLVEDLTDKTVIL
jgi:hypothetical protein